MRQLAWERWFIISVVAFASLFLVGTLPGSVDTFPYFLWVFIPSIFNLAACVIFGTTPSKS